MEQERRLAGTLTRPNRLVEAVLAGAAFDKANVHETTVWVNGLIRARDARADQNRGGRRYSDAQQARAEGLVRPRIGGGR